MTASTEEPDSIITRDIEDVGEVLSGLIHNFIEFFVIGVYIEDGIL